MRNLLQRALNFALTRSQEAEAQFKAWASRTGDPEFHALLAGLAAAERGRAEMLSRMIPEELTGRIEEPTELAALLVDVKEPRSPTFEQAIDAAIRRKGITAALYDGLAGLEGEAGSFFRAMADADRRATFALSEYAARLAREAARKGGSCEADRS